jgi:chromosome segregation ATPase
MTISPAQRRQNEDSIRAAIDRLLRGEIPPGSGCDIKTLAHEAGISRAALYRSYSHLKDEFERRLSHIRADGHQPDPRSAQILRLKDDNAQLRQRLNARDREIVELTAFKTTAISRIAAQHAEITALRAALATRSNVHALPARNTEGTHTTHG